MRSEKKLRFSPFWGLALLLLSSACGPSSKPKEEAEKLMNAGLPLARRAVVEGREMTPFAFLMTLKGESRPFIPTEESSGPASQAAIDSLIKSLREGAEGGSYRAIAIYAQVRIEPPSGGGVTDAIEVMLEHRGGYCVNAFFPYMRGDDGSLDFKGFFAVPRPGAVFKGCDRS
ncbi:MAG TPA: hypothetical protein VKF61_02585 [Candidatus Polarisedimenticolia bacterium]|nr:hypothetical protein [Candidatus Polarisedimenticolia bacterium]